MVKVKNKNLNIRQIADSGQTFRFYRVSENEFLVHAMDKELLITQAQEDEYIFNCREDEYDTFWKHYFDMDTDYSRFTAAVPVEDEFLSAAVRYGYGMRILNQDPWEMLISFIISQRKSIPAIRTSIEKLCEKCGKPMEGVKGTWYAFPTPRELSCLEFDEIVSCSVGYRAPYIYEAAKKVSDGELDIYGWKNLEDEELTERLMAIKGVGIKVCNCVMLFGYHRIGAFPIDVWIRKMIDEHYGGSFPLEKYTGFAGVIQQYIFFYGRELAAAGKR